MHARYHPSSNAGKVLSAHCSNVFWLYNTLDNGVTITYMEASMDSTQDMYDQLIVLANLHLVGLSAEEAQAVIGTDTKGFEPFEKDGCLYVGQICLLLDNNRTIVRIGEQ